MGGEDDQRPVHVVTHEPLRVEEDGCEEAAGAKAVGDSDTGDSGPIQGGLDNAVDAIGGVGEMANTGDLGNGPGKGASKPVMEASCSPWDIHMMGDHAAGPGQASCESGIVHDAARAYNLLA